jgi:bifunctional UDP-N-acetylglucosamine pyrophosphorylase/glucosamine-1-phosphate N-acetyltransferase
MRPLTETRPKALLEVAGATVVDHLLLALKAAGVTEVAVVVGHMADPLVRHLSDGTPLPVRTYRQARALGTGDALKAAAAFVKGDTLVVNGDVLPHAEDVRAVIQADAQGAEAVLLTAEVRDASRYGVVVTEAARAGSPARITKLVEKPERPPSRHVNAGVYRVGDQLMERLARAAPSPRGEVEITTALAAAAEAGAAFALGASHPWTEVGRPWDLLTAQERLFAGLKDRTEGEVEKGAVLKGDVFVAKGALVKAGAYIEGPVYIGPDARVGPNCYIRPATHIGAECHVGAASEVKNSVLFAHTHAPHHNYVGDSVIGSHVNLGSGTKIANLRLDEREVFVSIGGARVGTGLRKFGAVLGDSVKTGINASINAGSIIGPGAFIGPGARASGTVEAGARVM